MLPLRSRPQNASSSSLSGSTILRPTASSVAKCSATSHLKFPSIGRTVAALSYNARVKTWDVIVVGGGIIGLSLSIALHKRGLRVLVVERGEPGREASHAAAGMLADCPLETPAALQALATASARMYPEFVLELQDESGMKVDLRDQGTLLLAPEHAEFLAQNPLPASLAELEPALSEVKGPVAYLKERSVDPARSGRRRVKGSKTSRSGYFFRHCRDRSASLRWPSHWDSDGSNPLQCALRRELRGRVGGQFLYASLPYPPGQRTDAGRGLRPA